MSTQLIDMAPKTADKKPAKVAAPKKTPSVKKDGKKAKSKGVESWKIYIYKVLKQVHPDTGHQQQGHLHPELVHPGPVREDRHGGRQARALQQEADGDQSGDPDRCAPHPARRACQARRVGGHQGGDQVHLRVSIKLAATPWCLFNTTITRNTGSRILMSALRRH